MNDMNIGKGMSILISATILREFSFKTPRHIKKRLRNEELIIFTNIALAFKHILHRTQLE